MLTAAAPRSLARVVACASVAVAAPALALVATASAAPMAYMVAGLDIVRVPLDGSAPAQVIATGSDAAGLRGLALDPARGIMLTSQAMNRHIRTAPIAGGQFTDVNTGAAHAVVFPAGLSVDPATGTAYWVGEDNRLGRAALDGSGGALIPITGGVTSQQAYGAAYEPSRQLLWWTDEQTAGAIYATPADGSATTTLATGAAAVRFSYFLAIDRVGGWAYWTNGGYSGVADGGVMRAALDGSGGGRIEARDNARGIALDTAGGRVYWLESANTGTRLYSAGLAGGDATEVPLGGVGGLGSMGLALLFPPTAGALAVTGSATTGATLTCGVTWQPDSPEAFAFRAPASSSVRWVRDGSVIGDATGTTYAVPSPGSYACQGIATNAAGTTVATSDGITVPAAAPDDGGNAVARLSASWAVRGRSVTATFRVPAGANRFTMTATKRGARNATRGRCRVTSAKARTPRSVACTMKLAAGRWTATVTASRGATAVSRTVRTITVR